MYCLKDLGYLNAVKLFHWSHTHKNIFVSLIRILCQLVEYSFRQYEVETFLCYKEDKVEVRETLQNSPAMSTFFKPSMAILSL